MQRLASEKGVKATRREWMGLAVLALPCLLYSMDLTVLYLAVPQLTADLRPTATQLLWIVDIYGFLLAGALITMGTLGDRIGRRKVLLWGAAAFGLASILAAFATTAPMLIAARALLGVAAATLAPSTLSLIRNMFLDDRERTLAIGVWLACFSAGGAIGPFLGGLMLTHFWWGSVFLLNVPIMIATLVLGPLLLPEYRDRKAGRIDLASAALSIIAVLSCIWGLKHVAVAGIDVYAVASVALSGLVGWLFVRRQKALTEPLIDIALLRDRALRAALAINILTLFMAFGTFLFIAQYFQLVLGMSPLEAGLWTVPSGVVFVVGSLATPLLARKFQPSAIITVGLIIAAFGFAVLTQIERDAGLSILMVGMLTFCIGVAPIGTLTTDFVMSRVPPERAGAASGISETSFEFGAALGIAVLGSVAVAIYRSSMAGVANASADAQESIGAAVAAASSIPGDAGQGLMQAARNAYTTAFTSVALICCLIAALTAILAWRILRPHDAVEGTGSHIP